MALLDEKTAASGGRWLREAERGTVRARRTHAAVADVCERRRAGARGRAVERRGAGGGGVCAARCGGGVCEFDLAPDVRPADADKGQIGQVVQNLVLNAVQAMPSGGVIRLSLRNCAVVAGTVAALPGGDYLKLSVSDSGEGIPAEHLPRVLLKPFFTTKEFGSGLGLATVYSVVQKHRGHVEVESEPGRGTTFHLSLPGGADGAGRNRDLEVSEPAEPLQGRVLLFMDDEEPSGR